MFDVGFSELVLIAVIALIVVGPERLPKIARIAGLWVGRARRTLVSVKQEIDREMKAAELQEILKEQSRTRPLETILEDTINRPPSKSEPTQSVTPAAAPRETTGSRPS